MFRRRNKEQGFDKRKVYREEIIPILHQLEETCEKHGIPYLVWVIFSENQSECGNGLLMNRCDRDGSFVRKLRALGAIANEKEIDADILAKILFTSRIVSQLPDFDEEE